MGQWFLDHLDYVVTIFGSIVGFIILTRYRQNSTDNKIDKIFNKIDSFDNTLHSIQLENSKTGMNVINIKEQINRYERENDLLKERVLQLERERKSA